MLVLQALLADTHANQYDHIHILYFSLAVEIKGTFSDQRATASIYKSITVNNLPATTHDAPKQLNTSSGVGVKNPLILSTEAGREISSTRLASPSINVGVWSDFSTADSARHQPDTRVSWSRLVASRPRAQRLLTPRISLQSFVFVSVGF